MAPIRNAAIIRIAGIFSFNKMHQYEALEAVSESIADPFVNSRRHSLQIEGRSLHDYVPMYWATHTPMQYVVTIRDNVLSQDDLVFFECDCTDVLQLDGVLSTDGNAASGDARFYSGDGALPHLDWSILNCRKCLSPEYRWKKAAEVLVPDMVGIELINQISTFSIGAMRRLERISREIASHLGNKDAELPLIRVNTNLYY